MSHPFNGLVIGQAGRATRALLDRLLADAATTFPEWVALVLLSDGDIAEDDLVGHLTARLGDAEAGHAVAALAANGLTSAGVTLTDAGRARFQRIGDGVDRIAQKLYGDLSAEDKAIAGRVLAEVTARAEAELAA
ncbi:hypothetical protein [Actinokineospora cianjurensis]|uniref:DNA-binding MarR family transcriptional regulator n=1 Tax=Actinokineospora cianjurensis TaxID=585224 RepID=A0A421B2R8_9PSEU|nr:hypothetical protein [Actinokineospora cianjurensis]RLK58654.1 hypothetical protein CLV68_3126 [Actinokineospora cianjurensis]